ncbi:hypothetical protein T08_16660 [Trichinella sp. T8]|nr:hypothetical protein T08_16660 [Trichinella sp. T8]
MPRLEAELAESIGVAIFRCFWGLAYLKFDHSESSSEFLSPDQSFSASQLHSSTASPDVVCMTFDRLFQLLTVSDRPELSLKPAPDCEYASREIPCKMILKEKFLFQVGQQGFACGQALLKWILLSSVRHHTWLVISSTKAQLSERPQKAPPADKKILCLSNLHNSRRQLGNDSKRLGIRSSWLKTLDASVRHLQAVRTWRAPHRGPYAFSLRVYATERPPYTEQLPTEAATLTFYHKRHSLPLAIFECRPDITPHRRIATIHPPCHEVSPFKPLLCSPVLVFMVNRF